MCAAGLECLDRLVEGTDSIERVCLDPSSYEAPQKPTPVVSAAEVLITEYCFDG